jgi:hypothetical protein
MLSSCCIINTPYSGMKSTSNGTNYILSPFRLLKCKYISKLVFDQGLAEM